MRACDRFVLSLPAFHNGTAEWLLDVKNRYEKFDITCMKEWLASSGLSFSSEISVRPPYEKIMFFCEYQNNESMVITVETNAGPNNGILVSSFAKWKNTPFVFIGWSEISHDENWMPDQVIRFKFPDAVSSMSQGAQHQNTELIDIASRASVRILQLLNCKNIIAIPHNPIDLLKPAIRAHWLKKGKEPIQKHYTLSVSIPGSPKKNAQREGEPTHIMPLHTCRGHFATYTEERKLFGRYTGTFWIPAHVRGNAKNGTITKDYALKPRTAPCN